MRGAVTPQQAYEASKRRVTLSIKRYQERADKQAAECQHKKRVIIEYPPTDFNGVTLEGGSQERCANHLCNKLMGAW